MKYSIGIFLIGSIVLLGCSSSNESNESKIVAKSISINATPSKVWEIITHENYAKELGNEFDKNAFVESD